MITKSDWALGLGGGVIINYSGTVTWEVPFSSCRLFLSCIRGAMNQVSSFGILNKRDQELSLNNVSVYTYIWSWKWMYNYQQVPHTIWLKDKQWFLSVSSVFQPLAWAAVKRGPGPSPPYSITSWNYCCKTNVKVSFGDYNPSHWANHIFNTPALHIVATSAQEVEDEPGKQEYDSTPYHIASARLLLLLL